MPARPRKPHVVVVGCGFAGIEAVRALSKAEVEITLVDRTNHHLFQPLLYQVATAGLSAPAVSAPIRHVLRPEMRRGNLTILKAEVLDIDAAGRSLGIRFVSTGSSVPGRPSLLHPSRSSALRAALASLAMASMSGCCPFGFQEETTQAWVHAGPAFDAAPPLRALAECQEEQVAACRTQNVDGCRRLIANPTTTAVQDATGAIVVDPGQISRHLEYCKAMLRDPALLQENCVMHSSGASCMQRRGFELRETPSLSCKAMRLV